MDPRPPRRPVERRGLHRLVPARWPPGLSPAQLATVCVLQYVLNLSDRQAAEAVRCRIDFKYALGLESDLVTRPIGGPGAPGMAVKAEPLDGLRDLAAGSPATTRPPIGRRDSIAAVGRRRRGRLRDRCTTSWRR
ncbi:transposase [Streptomyces sp. Ru72]|uniref:transposase n=1 Tax=Streptomyces sp. Ru72 TaxID=2080747 RepID=UPI0027E3DD71|nr:transposase [Streptomyces sp. Ru72]